MAEVNTRKAYREAQKKKKQEARDREAKRVEVEKNTPGRRATSQRLRRHVLMK